MMMPDPQTPPAADHPRVSVVVPCYNSATTLAATLESALAQTWRHLEVILVNDGSKDGSLDVARRYAARGVRVIDQPNRGAAAARNAGLTAATGTFIQFLDADDLLAPDKVEHQVLRLLREGGTLASGAWARFHGDPSKAGFVSEPAWRDLSGVDFLCLHFEGGWMMPPAAWLAARTVVERAGPWDESLSLNDDGEYFARVMLAAREIKFCAGARSYYRSGNAASLSARRDRRALESLHRSVASTFDHLLAAETSPRTRSAVAAGWKWIAFELYPDAPDLADEAEARSHAFGGSPRPLPAGGRFQLASRVLGWRLAKRLFC